MLGHKGKLGRREGGGGLAPAYKALLLREQDYEAAQRTRRKRPFGNRPMRTKSPPYPLKIPILRSFTKPKYLLMRLMQHKREAYWFYRYLSNFYDKLVNPFFWTARMREESLDLVNWDKAEELSVIDVGSGTGFTTEGIVSRVPAEQVVCVDQSPHQMARAKSKEALMECSFRLGDAEQIPFADDSFDRYVSAGSIEYWPNPQQGINEAYRVIKPGGWALLIGPLEPKMAFSRFIANTWMLFPPARDYKEWFQKAGFEDIRWKYIKPHWQKNERYGIAIAGRKPRSGKSPNASRVAQLRTETSLVSAQPEGMSLGRGLLLAGRVALGSAAGFLFIPIALVGYISAPLRGIEGPYEPLNREQKAVLIGLGALAVGYLTYRMLKKK